MSYSWVDKYASQIVSGLADLAISGFNESGFQTLLERGEIDLYLLAGMKSGNAWKIRGFRMLHVGRGDIELPGDGPAELINERQVAGPTGF